MDIKIKRNLFFLQRESHFILHRKMNLESLSGEIIFEIFDFLHDTDILQSFSNLNNRFNGLLVTYFRVSPQLDLHSMTKSYFHMACNSFIPLIADNIHSLRLSDNDDTPHQTALFLFHSLSLYYFPRLKSLTLDNMHSEAVISQMMIEWQYPLHLTHLNIINCRILNDWNIVYTLINNIWSLPRLTHCQLDINIVDDVYSIVPTVMSSTLEVLAIKNMRCNLRELFSLFEHTPRLRHLDISINETINDHRDFAFSLPLITTLKLTYEGSFSALRELLKNVPNVCHCAMRTKNIVVKGKSWAKIISHHLPKLKIFHLRMEFDQVDLGSTLEKFLLTYKTDFWLKVHRWHTRVHSFYSSNHQKTVLLYTLAYAFHDHEIFDSGPFGRIESCYSNLESQMSYTHVHHLSCISLPAFLAPFRHRFSHVSHLFLILPFENRLWTLFPTFDHLRKLHITCSYPQTYNSHVSGQFQTFLDRAPRLRSLTFQSSINLVLPLLECIGKSITKIELQTSDEYFDWSTCKTLSLSQLAKQCHILSIKLHHRMNILQLVQKMSQIRTLNVDFPSNRYQTNDDQLIKWLQCQLPPTCMVAQDMTHSNRIQLWIR